MLQNRRIPWPADIKLDGRQFMLGKSDKESPLVVVTPPGIDEQAQTDGEYSAQNPVLGRTQPWNSLVMGYGLSVQDKWEDERYFWGEGVDMSNGLWMLGPQVHQIPIDSSHRDTVNGVTRFFEIGGVLYAMNGQFINKRTGDGGTQWEVGYKDLTDLSEDDPPVPLVAQDVISLQANSSGAKEYVYFALGDDCEIARFDGTTWELHSAETESSDWDILHPYNHTTYPDGNPSPPPEYRELRAHRFGVVGRELYRAHSSNVISKVDVAANPFIEANWSAENTFSIGDQSKKITRVMPNLSGAAIICKEDGMFSVDADGYDHELYPNLRQVPSASGGAVAGAWGNDWYIAYPESIFRMSVDWQIEPVGPERLLNNDSPVRGQATALCGHDNFCLYAAFWNPDPASDGSAPGNAYLMKFGAWSKQLATYGQTEPGLMGNQRQIDVWHGSLIDALHTKVTCLYRSTVGADEGHQRMYMGFADGTVGWFNLPCSANPSACASYEYQSEGVVHLPVWNGTFANDIKALHQVTSYARYLNASSPRCTAQVFYQDYDTPGPTWTSLLPFDSLAMTEAEFPPNTQFSRVRFKVMLSTDRHVNGTGDPPPLAQSPILNGLGLRHHVILDMRFVYQFNILLGADLAKRDGSPLRLSPNQIRQFVREAGAKSWVECYFIDGKRIPISLVDMGETNVWDERSRTWQGAIQIKAVDYAGSRPQL